MITYTNDDAFDFSLQEEVEDNNSLYDKIVIVDGDRYKTKEGKFCTGCVAFPGNNHKLCVDLNKANPEITCKNRNLIFEKGEILC